MPKKQTIKAASTADAVTTQIIHHGLEGAAEQMRVATIRTAFSPIIYDAYDFSAALYDRNVQLLAQSKTLPLFLGTMDVCIDAALRTYGEQGLKEGDVILMNYGYDTGTHANDVGMVIPGFIDGELAAFAVLKAHMMDVAGKNAIVPTDSTDIWQEGTIYPTVRLYVGGERNDDIYRTVMINSRMPQALEGDLNAMIAAGKTGLTALNRLVSRYGADTFNNAVQMICNHGEQTVRDVLRSLPDGRWTAKGSIDDNGINDELIEYELEVEIDGDEICIDLSNAPPQTGGPVNNARGSMVSTIRAAIMGFTGITEAVNEGHFRPIVVKTTPGTIFDAKPPAPIGVYAFHLSYFVDVIYEALAEPCPERVPAGGCDLGGTLSFGLNERDEFWGGSFNLCGGQGAALHYGDGGSPLIHIFASGSRLTSWEVWEERFPMQVEWSELDMNTGGVGEYQGGLGSTHRLTALENMNFTAMFDRTKMPVHGLNGGGDGGCNTVRIYRPDNSTQDYSKATFEVPKGSVLEIKMSGGGGYGAPNERDRQAVLDDIREEYISEEFAKEVYPQAFK